MTTTEEIVTINGSYFADGIDDLDNGEVWDIDPGETRFGALEINSFIHGDDCDVVYLQDKNQDGTFEISVTIDSLVGEGISQHNKTQVGENAEEILRIINTSGGPADFAVTGMGMSQ